MGCLKFPSTPSTFLTSPTAGLTSTTISRQSIPTNWYLFQPVSLLTTTTNLIFVLGLTVRPSSPAGRSHMGRSDRRMLKQVYVPKDVLTAAKERISYIFDEFEDIVVSISGGKDSTAL